jgi:hypothetical protein
MGIVVMLVVGGGRVKSYWGSAVTEQADINIDSNETRKFERESLCLMLFSHVAFGYWVDQILEDPGFPT